MKVCTALLLAAYLLCNICNKYREKSMVHPASPHRFLDEFWYMEVARTSASLQKNITWVGRFASQLCPATEKLATYVSRQALFLANTCRKKENELSYDWAGILDFPLFILPLFIEANQKSTILSRMRIKNSMQLVLPGLALLLG